MRKVIFSFQSGAAEMLLVNWCSEASLILNHFWFFHGSSWEKLKKKCPSRFGVNDSCAAGIVILPSCYGSEEICLFSAPNVPRGKNKMLLLSATAITGHVLRQ